MSLMPVGLAQALAAVICAAGLLLSGGDRPAEAQAVSLGCTVSMSTVAFGSVDVLPGAAIATSATLSISCLNVSVSSGSLYACIAFPTPRTMAGSSASLTYDLFGPAPATTSWSNTTPIVIPLGSLTLLQTVTIPIAASLLAGQATKPPGAYMQTVTANVTYGSTSCTSGQAGSGAFSFQATATVLKSCNVSAANLDFGAVGDLNALVDGAGSLAVQCTSGTGFTIALDGGLTGATDPTQRLMRGGASETVTYGLYRDVQRGSPWGAVPGSNTNGGTGTAGTQTIPVYGRVPIQATPSIGTYSDTIVASVTY